MNPAHKRMSRVLGFCLTLEDAAAWSNFTTLALARMSLKERVCLAFAALNALEPDEAEQTARASIGAAGWPLPSFLGGMAEARFWAQHASRGELKAYAAACFEAMSPSDQAAFFRHISEMEIAA